MESIPLPEYDAVSLDMIALGLSGLRTLLVNVFALEHANGGWSLIDAGLPGSAGRIRRWVEGKFGKGARPDSILLTHGHFDHTGALKELAEGWDVPVYAHPLEFPFLNGQSKYPPPDSSVGGGLMAVMSPLYPRGPIDVSARLRPLPEGALPGLPDWQWIHTPGHTVGHVSFYRAKDTVLVVGDAFCTTNQESFLAVAAQKPELHGPPAYYTPDWDAARASVQKLALLKPGVLAPGHGLPMKGPEVTKALDRLAAQFDAIARPAHK